MAKYSAHVGRRVDVTYRAGEIVQSARGTLVADTGRSIFLEESSTREGTRRTIRWEIPYQFILAVNESADSAGPENSETSSNGAPDHPRDHSPFSWRKRPYEA
ncbi:MAG TPA: hypothetical protein VNL38_02895 [Candidatus Nitrosotenuis sp.]|nr:hypothetical protein [Candidatus Nitrosotenuis sp.]